MSDELRDALEDLGDAYHARGKALKIWMLVAWFVFAFWVFTACSLAALTFSQGEGERTCMKELSACQLYLGSLEEACYYENGQNP